MSLYMSVNVFVSPVCVSHPKQSEMTAHSEALKAAEPVLKHTKQKTIILTFIK